MVESISQVRPDALSIFAGTTFAGIVSSLAWGLGYFGQPHIIVRFMAMRTPADAKSGRRIGISWMVLTVFGALSGAFMGIAYFARDVYKRQVYAVRSRWLSRRSFRRWFLLRWSLRWALVSVRPWRLPFRL